MKFTDKELEQAIADGIFNKTNDVLVPPATVIRYFEKWAKLKCKETAKNVRHLGVEMVTQAHRNVIDGGHVDMVLSQVKRDIMNIQFKEVKPK